MITPDDLTHSQIDFTLPWYKYPFLSKTTLVIPFSRSFAPNWVPSSYAFSVLVPVMILRSAIPKTVTPFDTTWPTICLLDLDTTNLGKSVLSLIVTLVRFFLLAYPAAARRNAFVNLFIGPTNRRIKYKYYFFAVLPALSLIVSFEYLTPLPLYGSGALSALIWDATWPISCLSILVKIIISNHFGSFSTVAVTLTGREYGTGWEYHRFITSSDPCCFTLNPTQITCSLIS